MNKKQNKALEIVKKYTITATGTGAIPIPFSSIGIIAENTLMIAHIARIMKQPVSLEQVSGAMIGISLINNIGRTIFLEGAKMLSWGTGSVWALGALSGLGATTAGVQTYTMGLLAIEFAKNGGNVPSNKRVRQIVSDANETYKKIIEI